MESIHIEEQSKHNQNFGFIPALPRFTARNYMNWRISVRGSMERFNGYKSLPLVSLPMAALEADAIATCCGHLPDTTSKSYIAIKQDKKRSLLGDPGAGSPVRVCRYQRGTHVHRSLWLKVASTKEISNPYHSQ